MKRSVLRSIPSVERLVQALGATALPRPVVVRLIRDELARLRRNNRILEPNAILDRLRERVAQLRRARIQPVINATGIIIHTNLGRSLLAPAAIERLVAVASRYCNLELDLETGARGARSGRLEESLALLCQAGAATVVNNCAAALVLILRHLVRPARTEVILSRGELVQIGGGFRIPEILEASGARLREVGTTNQTTANDYRRAVNQHTALILKVHRSNFSMEGFVGSPASEEIIAVARKARVPYVEDLGSGAIADTAVFPGFTHEPTPAEVLRRGADLVCFSGDKLLGGPQAGVIAGKARLIAGLKREPFFRALRCDKLVLAALEATVDAHLAGEAGTTIPTLALARIGADELRARAARLHEQLSTAPLEVRIGPGLSRLGGGTQPGSSIESVTLDLRPRGWTVVDLAARLRRGDPPVLGCIAGGRLKLDLRTVLPEQDELLARAIRAALDVPARPGTS